MISGRAFNGHAPRPSDQFATNPSGFVMTSSDRITGVLSPVVTRFTSELDVDVPRFVAHCRWLLSQDCGVGFLCTNQEAEPRPRRCRAPGAGAGHRLCRAAWWRRRAHALAILLQGVARGQAISPF